jgi:HSP20 family protein
MQRDCGQSNPLEFGPPGFIPGRDPFHQIDEALGRMGLRLEVMPGHGPQPAWPWSVWSSDLLAVEETDDAYIIEVELPGLSAQDLDVRVQHCRLSIRGEVDGQNRAEGTDHGSRSRDRFEHMLPLPAGTDPDGITATLSDGLLTVHIPKAELTESHRIEVIETRRS